MTDLNTPTKLLRAADMDRQLTVDALKAHYVAGRLTAHALGERISRALAAQTHGDLAFVMRDLPSTSEPAVSRVSPATPPVPLHPVKRAFAPHVASYAAVMMLLLAIWLLTTPGGYFWPVWPMLGWGLGLAKHGIFATYVRGARGASRWSP